MEELTITIDGGQFSDFECFIQHAANALFEHVDIWWNGDLDALDDILSSLPNECRILWRRSDLSRHCMGYWAMANWLATNIKYCHPSNIPDFAERLRKARLCEGQTLFDWLVQIIHDHENVQLVLE